jgi:hypothetical protein
MNFYSALHNIKSNPDENSSAVDLFSKSLTNDYVIKADGKFID